MINYKRMRDWIPSIVSGAVVVVAGVVVVGAGITHVYLKNDLDRKIEATYPHLSQDYDCGSVSGSMFTQSEVDTLLLGTDEMADILMSRKAKELGLEWKVE